MLYADTAATAANYSIETPRTAQDMEAELATLNADMLSQAAEARRKEFERDLAQIRSQEQEVQSKGGVETVATTPLAEQAPQKPPTFDPVSAALLMSPQMRAKATTNLVASETERPLQTATPPPARSDPFASLGQALRKDLALRQVPKSV